MHSTSGLPSGIAFLFTPLLATVRRVVRCKAKKSASWRLTVGLGAATVAATLLANIGILVWTKTSGFDHHDGVITVFSGSCHETASVSTWAHLAINLLSTLLLGASNNCQQLLTSPSRNDIDTAHRNGQWMNVGIPSLSNLTKIPRWRMTLWLALLVSSDPLHFVYNSVVFDIMSANAFQTTVVSSKFLIGESWNETRTFPDMNYADRSQFHRIKTLQKHVNNLTRLDNRECISTYGTSPFVSKWGDVLLVTSALQPETFNGSVVATWSSYPGSIGVEWRCPNEQCKGQSYCPNRNIPCNSTGLHDKAERWTHSGTGILPSVTIDYCLAQSTRDYCQISISTTILWIVIAANVIKLLCLGMAIRAHDFVPLATVGDAVESFMDRPDQFTQCSGPLSAGEVKYKGAICYPTDLAENDTDWDVRIQGNLQFSGINTSTVIQKRGETVSLMPSKCNSRRWFHAVEFLTWWYGYLLCSFAMLTVILLSAGAFKTLRQAGFGRIPTTYVLSGSATYSLFSNIIIVNLPQVASSVFYLVVNSVLTRMIVADECTKFASIRKPLRVSQPRGQQRTTFWLGLPYRYIVPLLTAMTLLHWTLSRSLFFVDVMLYNEPTVPPGSPYTTASGYSPMAFVISLSIGVFIMLALAALAFRRLDLGMPIIGTCSLAISAASHPSHEEQDPAILPLMYGIIVDDHVSGRKSPRAGFSSEEVIPLAKL